jgi:hypothetical protein
VKRTEQKEDQGHHGKVPAGLRGETFRLDANAEGEKVEIGERPVGATGDSKVAPWFSLVLSRAKPRERRRGATCPERSRPSNSSGR